MGGLAPDHGEALKSIWRFWGIDSGKPMKGFFVSLFVCISEENHTIRSELCLRELTLGATGGQPGLVVDTVRNPAKEVEHV